MFVKFRTSLSTKCKEQQNSSKLNHRQQIEHFTKSRSSLNFGRKEKPETKSKPFHQTSTSNTLKQRRRTSSSSVNSELINENENRRVSIAIHCRESVDMSRGSIDMSRGSIDMSRSGLSNVKEKNRKSGFKWMLRNEVGVERVSTDQKRMKEETVEAGEESDGEDFVGAFEEEESMEFMDEEPVARKFEGLFKDHKLDASPIQSEVSLCNKDVF